MSYAILRTAKLRTFTAIAGSGEHNFRERETLNANAERTALNKHIGAQNTAELIAGIKARLPEKHRKDAIRCIEYFIGASPEFFGDDWEQAKNHKAAYFNDAVEWIKARHGAENVICSTLQLDEKSPHLCVYVVPRTPTGGLSAKHFFGNKSQLSKMQTEFASKVGANHGLERGVEGSKATHRAVKQFYGALAHPARSKPPTAPPEPSMIEIATGKARTQLADYATDLRTYADQVEKAAAVVHLGESNRRAQAKAIAQVRQQKDAEIERLQQENRQLHVNLTNNEASLIVASTDAQFWKSEAKKLEANFTKAKAGFAELRKHLLDVLPHLPDDLRKQYEFLKPAKAHQPPAHTAVVQNETERDADCDAGPSP
jgi:hypothetical protein